MLKRTRWSSERAGAPLDDRRRRREHERGPGAEERGAGKRADGADRDRASVVHLDRKRLAEADEHDERDQGEDIVAGAEQEPEHARPDSDRPTTKPTRSASRRESDRKRGPCTACVRGWRRSSGGIELDGRRQWLEVVARLRDRHQPRLAVARDRQRLGARVEHAVSALELRAVDGEVRLVDELVRVLAVAWDRRRRRSRPSRGSAGSRSRRRRRAPRPRADPLGDLQRLLRARLGKQDAELLAAEPRRDVVVAQLRAEDLGDALEHGVAGEMAVRVVDVAQEVEVGHDQRERTVEALRAHDLLVERDAEVARVEEPGLRVDARLGLELGHGERPVDQEHGGDRERDQPRVRVPERREHDAEGGEHELGREAVEREEARLADRVPVREQEHRSEHRVVQSDEDDRACEPGDGEAEARCSRPARPPAG